jgi:hypothetical protein
MGWLAFHVSIYTAVTVLGWLIFFFDEFLVDDKAIIIVTLITFITHFITDYFTSKWTSRLWEKKEVHNFFVVIGLDQLIHSITLIFTFYYLTNF